MNLEDSMNAKIQKEILEGYSDSVEVKYLLMAHAIMFGCRCISGAIEHACTHEDMSLADVVSDLTSTIYDIHNERV